MYQLSWQTEARPAYSTNVLNSRCDSKR